MFKTTWKQLEQEMPVVFLAYKDVEQLLERHGSSGILDKLKELSIYTNKPVAVHRSPSYGSD